jgi:hemerythrin-like domain-containing protein
VVVILATSLLAMNHPTRDLREDGPQGPIGRIHMCDYCGCHDSEPFAELAREHEVLENLGSELRTALGSGDERRARVLFERIVAVLGPHVRKEERGVLAQVIEEGGIFQRVTQKLIEEHHDLQHLIEHMDDVPADWAQEALHVLDALDAHIGNEEWDLFPAALGLLSFEELESMARIHAEEGSAIKPAR